MFFVHYKVYVKFSQTILYVNVFTLKIPSYLFTKFWMYEFLIRYVGKYFIINFMIGIWKILKPWNIFSSTNILFLKSVPVSVFGVLGDSWSKFTFSDDWFDDQTSLIWITGITSGRVPIKTNKKLVVLVYRNPNFCLVLFFQLFVYFCW